MAALQMNTNQNRVLSFNCAVSHATVPARTVHYESPERLPVCKEARERFSTREADRPGLQLEVFSRTHEACPGCSTKGPCQSAAQMCARETSACLREEVTNGGHGKL